VDHQPQAWRLIGRSFVGLAVSCALVLQLLLLGLALGGASASAASDDPFVICYGGSSGDADHPDRGPGKSLHCLLVCAQAHSSLAAAVPPSSPILDRPQAATAASILQAASPVVPARFGLAHPSRGPPGSA
jgi:hypothetical protein